MKKQLKILFVSSEVAPFAKTGGLADVSGSLPKVLKEMNHDVRIVMPKYGSINERKYVLREVIRLKDIKVTMGDKDAVADVKSSFLPNTKVQVYFVGNKDYFNRKGYYGDPVTNEDWPDNAERFGFFSHSCLEILKKLHWQPDIIHCNDWQTALIPFYLKTLYNDESFFDETKTLLSIHNLAFQGIFEKDNISFLNVEEFELQPGGELDFGGRINFLKAGILHSDVISTVSKTYAKEIQKSEEFGFGLQSYLKKRSKDLFGIVNGIDYDEWNPETDKLIPNNYTKNDLSGKVKNKIALIEKFGLKFDPNIPLIGTVSRLTDQKGFDIITKAIDDMMKLDLQYVILGVGEVKYQNLLKKYAKKYSKKLAIEIQYDNKLAHEIEAGSDIFLMPSKFEPCGLNQLYSLKYGTIPIVRSTGGLADTIKNYTPETGRGYGFVFDDYSSKALLQVVKKAIELFKNQDTWKKLINRAMKQDFSWSKAAEKYVELYNSMNIQ
ncbi:starch synthase [candidate division KSB1 bacterium 4572_119]|nr:MAG: starch synthase [candidate division KSB1 bacterium 4572_119]